MADADDPIPQSEDGLYDEASGLQDAGRHEEAVPLFQTLTQRWPNAGYFLHLSDCEGELHRWEDAEASARAALELKPEDWVILRRLGVCLDEQQRIPEASAAYERSLEEEDNPATRVFYASMLRKSGDMEGARRQLEICTSKFPDYDEAWFNFGGLWQDDDPKRALRLMQSALAIDPEYGLYHAWVAYMHGVLAHVDEARHHLREARRIGSEHECFQDLLETTSAWLLKIDRKRHPHRNPQAE